MKNWILLLLLCLLITLTSCGKTVENYLILSDVQGNAAFQENTPDARVVNVRAKAIIKAESVVNAQKQALSVASQKAVDQVVREVTTAEQYNANYKKIDAYFKKNIEKYILASQITGTRKIYEDRFLGIFASFKVSRQKIVVALQKDLHVLDTSTNTMVAVVTSKKDASLGQYGIKLADVENALLNQAQTDLNQRGLYAIDYHNALAQMAENKQQKAKLQNVSKDQFLNLVNAKKETTNSFYGSGGIKQLQQIAKIVIEVNVMSISKTKNTMALNLSVTAKNTSFGTRGAFANTVIQVARKGNDSSDNTAMITALIQDSYSKMKKEFIPQVIKEMAAVQISDKQLIAYDIVAQGFSASEIRKIRRTFSQKQTDSIRYIDYNNELQRVRPSLVLFYFRSNEKATHLADYMLDTLDSIGLHSQEPLVAPGQTDIIFIKK